MIRLNRKLSMLDLSRALLFLLIVSINIREPLFHTREILFCLVVITSFLYIDVNQLKYAIVLIGIWLISAAYNMLVPGSNYSLNLSGMNTVVVAAYLFLMCFFQNRYAQTIIKSYMFSSTVVAIITALLWLVCNFSENYFLLFRNYFIGLQEKTGLTFISIDLRAILGTKWLTVWYRTSPCMICALGFCLIERINGKEKHTILILLYTFALVFSGTRANMLSAILLIFLYIAFWFSKKRLALLKMILLCASLVGAFILASKFLNDVTSESSMIKVSDISTYFKIYNSDIYRSLFFGWGPGSTFYSVGRGLTVDLTELTLFETIRRYGLVSTFVIFFYIWFHPLYIMLSKRNVKYKTFYISVLFAFIITACTNPYLLDSVGFAALVFFCVYFMYGTCKDCYDNQLALII